MNNISGSTATLQSAYPNCNATAAKPPTMERRCENADCNVGKLLSMVSHRKTSQFVTDPSIMDKPLLINGFTTIFQVDGQAARLSDIKNAGQPQPIYRIVPNTHSHIVNYVVVDGDADALKKINDNDPATMKKLIESQNQSARQMLKKLMSGHAAPVALNSGTSSANTKACLEDTNPVTTVRLMNRPNVTATAVVGSTTIKPQSSAPAAASPLSVRVHPNLKITAVPSRESSSVVRTSTIATKPTPSLISSTSSQMPIITPVPLATLQRAPVSSLTTSTAPSLTPSSVSSTFLPAGSTFTLSGGVKSSIGSAYPNRLGGVKTKEPEKPRILQLENEVQELRRTIAQLAHNNQQGTKSGVKRKLPATK